MCHCLHITDSCRMWWCETKCIRRGQKRKKNGNGALEDQKKYLGVKGNKISQDMQRHCLVNVERDNANKKTNIAYWLFSLYFKC